MVKSTNETIPQGTDTSSSLDRRFFEALRLEVKDVTATLAEIGETLSPRVLASSAARLAEVARYAETLQKGVEAGKVQALTTGPAASVAISPEGTVKVTNANGNHLDPAKAAQVLAMKKDGKTWKEIAAATALSVSQARYAFRQAKKNRRGARTGK